MNEMSILEILGRKRSLFNDEYTANLYNLENQINSSEILVVGGAGTIGAAVVKLLLSFRPKSIKIVDLSENNLAALMRDIRNSGENKHTNVQTFAIDFTSKEFERFFERQEKLDFILNFAALKHVRSESNVYALHRMINLNIIQTIRLLKMSEIKNCKRYFCVSTDKATDPVNLMGLTKLLMEKFLFSEANSIHVSSARFANVAFSDGSLLNSYVSRIEKSQPIVVPKGIRRYFVSPGEAAQICLLGCFCVPNKSAIFPKITEYFCSTSIETIAKRFLEFKGYKGVSSSSEEEAFASVDKLKLERNWPYFLSTTDTTGEKDTEEFFGETELLKSSDFTKFGLLTHKQDENFAFFDFETSWAKISTSVSWDKSKIVQLLGSFAPNFSHKETNKYLDQKR